MQRYLWRTPKREYPPEARLVHNFYPGPRDDPGRDPPMIGFNGFRIWITDGPPGTYGDERRCYCGWLDGREHYGTVGHVDEHGVVWFRGEEGGGVS
jgi:hypothetical protein